ncbi:MAG: anti-sigma factor [Anaerolineae bacterium]
MNRNQELEDKLPLYALQALEEPEMKEIEAYISHFPEVAAELKKLQESANLLPYAAPLRTPPLDIKSSVLSYAKANPRQAQAQVEAAQQEKIVSPKKVQRPIAKVPVAPEAGFGQKLRDWWKSMQTGLALPVALALSLVAIGIISNRLLSAQGQVTRLNGIVAGLTNDVNSLESDVDELTANNQSLETKVADLESENGQLVISNLALTDELASQQQVVAYAADANSQRISVLGTDAQPDASAGLFIRPETGELLLVISQLEPLSEDQTHQLWLIEDQPVSAGLIEISPEGTGIFEIDVALEDIDFSAIGISVEPAGGSEQPTGDIVLFANA